MRSFLLILFMIIGIGFFTSTKTVNTSEKVSFIESLFQQDVCAKSSSPHGLFIISKNVSNNNTALDPTSLYTFYTNLCFKFNRINNLLSQEANIYLKNILRQKSIFDLLSRRGRVQYDSSTSLYKLLNSCNFYTFHNHRIII